MAKNKCVRILKKDGAGAPGDSPWGVCGVSHSARGYVEVTHATKEKVLAACDESYIHRIGKNPDIWVKSRNDDTIILTPSATRRKGGEVKDSKQVTAKRASDLFGDEWRSKIPVLRLRTTLDAIENFTEGDKGSGDSDFLYHLLRSRSLDSVIVSPDGNTLVVISWTPY